MIKLNNLSLDFAGNIIFKNISLHINKTDKIGLIGNNGSGKTTLLNLLSKKINPTAGSISKNKEINIAYLPQELYFNSDLSLKEFVVGNNSELIELDIRIDDINFYSVNKSVKGIKIDTEGEDLNVLIGSQKTIQKFKPKIIIEVRNENKVNIQKILNELKYEIYSVDDHSNILDLKNINIDNAINVFAKPF